MQNKYLRMNTGSLEELFLKVWPMIEILMCIRTFRLFSWVYHLLGRYLSLMKLFCQISTELDVHISICFVVDGAFPLSIRCMKHFSKIDLTDEEHIFNNKLSRYRRVTENELGIGINRFRLFATKAHLTSEKAITVVMASLTLHSLLRTKIHERYTSIGFANEEDGHVT